MSESPPDPRPLSRRTLLRGVAGAGALGVGGAVAGDPAAAESGGNAPESPLRTRRPGSDGEADDQGRDRHDVDCDDVTDQILREAIVDWAMGNLSDDQLESLIVCWATGGTDDPDYR